MSMVSQFSSAYKRIRAIRSKARGQAWQAVNVAMVTAYWNIGKVIVEEEQKGKARAGYGEGLIESLSKNRFAIWGDYE